MSECKHFWSVVHAVYGGDKGSTCVRRWCSDCGEEQVGEVTKWRAPRQDEFDQPAEKAAKEISKCGDAWKAAAELELLPRQCPTPEKYPEVVNCFCGGIMELKIDTIIRKVWVCSQCGGEHTQWKELERK